MASQFTLLIVAAVVAACSSSPSSLRNPLRPWWGSRSFSGGRIVGGYEIDIAEVPFQVSLAHSFGHFCGGSIISSRWVLSAGHCSISAEYPGIFVRVGSSKHAAGGRQIEVKRVIQHPQYDAETTDYDFALLELEQELELSDNCVAVELPEQDEPVEDGTCLQVSGWGNTQNVLESNDVLRATNVPAYNQQACSEAYDFFGGVTERMICAGYDKGGKDACQGDSGGPLVEGNKLVGVVSWGKGCAEEGFPGVYSRVAAVRDWISKTTGV